MSFLFISVAVVPVTGSSPPLPFTGSLELVIASLHCYIGVGCTVFAEVDDFRILVESKVYVGNGTSLYNYALV
jgi:hypothetical protein